MLTSLYFFHPDYTVGTGIKPVQLYCSRARRHHTALPPVGSRTPPRSYIIIVGPVKLHVKMEITVRLIYTSNIMLKLFIYSIVRGVFCETFLESSYDSRIHFGIGFPFRMLRSNIR